MGHLFSLRSVPCRDAREVVPIHKMFPHFNILPRRPTRASPFASAASAELQTAPRGRCVFSFFKEQHLLLFLFLSRRLCLLLRKALLFRIFGMCVWWQCRIVSLLLTVAKACLYNPIPSRSSGAPSRSAHDLQKHSVEPPKSIHPSPPNRQLQSSFKTLILRSETLLEPDSNSNQSPSRATHVTCLAARTVWRLGGRRARATHSAVGPVP